jgi:alanyl aminopeptidase
MYAQIGRMVPDRQWQVPVCVGGPGIAPHCRIVGRTADVALGSACPAYVLPNALGKGYYRFAYDARGWQAMIKASPAIDPADQRVLFGNIDAALHADQAEAGDLFGVTEAMAPNAQWDLVNAVAATYHLLRVRQLGPKDEAAYEEFIRKNFVPRLTALGLMHKPNEDPAAELERGALVKLLVEEGRDPDTLERLTKAAQIYLASGEKSLGGLSTDLATEAMRAAILSKGTEFGVPLMAAYQASNDDYFHRAVLYAIAGSSDSKFLDSVFDMALTPKIHAGDIRYFYEYMAEEPAARTALWDWFRTHYAALLKRVSAEEIPRAPSLFNEACDPDTRKSLEDFFRPQVATVPGLARSLDLAEERIDRCIAFRDAKAKDVRDALAAATK